MNWKQLITSHKNVCVINSESLYPHHSRDFAAVEGYIIIATNVHGEATDDDVHDIFADYGEICQLHLNLDRRSGYIKGYALIEFATFKEANAAVNGAQGALIHDKPISVAWAFVKPPAQPRVVTRR